jgi:hypothetical protein
MVMAIVVTIKFFKWEMTKGLGYCMFAMYFMYLVFALLVTPRKEYVVAKCTSDFKFAPF